jgi:signal peptidase I
MMPNIIEGDRILAIKLNKPPKRGAVVIFKANESEFWIKRVIGLAGETININDGKVQINGRDLRDFANDPAYKASFGPVQIPLAHYFLIGDNRSIIHDSRMIGPVPLEDIHYKALLIYRPIHRIKFLI